MLPYVRMVVSLIDGVELTCDELVELLRQALRQHSIALIGAGRLRSGFSASAPTLGGVDERKRGTFELGPAV
jgi:hypothetical protein